MSAHVACPHCQAVNPAVHLAKVEIARQAGAMGAADIVRSARERV